MIRWRFVLTRLVLLLLILAFMEWGLGPLIRWSAHSTLESTTGREIRIGPVSFSALTHRLVFESVSVPGKDSQELAAISMRKAEVQLSPISSLRKQWVVEKATINGLEIAPDKFDDTRASDSNSSEAVSTLR